MFVQEQQSELYGQHFYQLQHHSVAVVAGTVTTAIATTETAAPRQQTIGTATSCAAWLAQSQPSNFAWT